MIDADARIGRDPEHRDFNPETDEKLHPEIDRTARVGAFCTVDAGMREPTWIGARTFLMSHVHVGHDAFIGEDCELAPHCIVGGHVMIEDRVRVGMGAIFKPYVTVGAGARIGCGAVVIRDVPPGEVWAGNPAKPIRQTAGNVVSLDAYKGAQGL